MSLRRKQKNSITFFAWLSRDSLSLKNFPSVRADGEQPFRAEDKDKKTRRSEGTSKAGQTLRQDELSGDAPTRYHRPARAFRNSPIDQ